MSALAFCAKTGELTLGGYFIGQGYSGAADGKNNPALQNVHNVGPIPEGFWRITGFPHAHPKLGPFVLNLEPVQGTETFGRSGFCIHGEAESHVGASSHGCIVLSLDVRQAIWESGERVVRVVIEPVDPDAITPLDRPIS